MYKAASNRRLERGRSQMVSHRPEGVTPGCTTTSELGSRRRPTRLARCAAASTVPPTSPSGKGKVYAGGALAVLLYGCESWCLTAESEQRLGNWHNKRIREICLVAMCQAVVHRITSESPQKRTGVFSLEHYLASRTLPCRHPPVPPCRVSERPALPPGAGPGCSPWPPM